VLAYPWAEKWQRNNKLRIGVLRLSLDEDWVPHVALSSSLGGDKGRHAPVSGSGHRRVGFVFAFWVRCVHCCPGDEMMVKAGKDKLIGAKGVEKQAEMGTAVGKQRGEGGRKGGGSGLHFLPTSCSRHEEESETIFRLSSCIWVPSCSCSPPK